MLDSKIHARAFTKDKVDNVVQWIRINYSDEVVRLSSFSKNLTIHQLACAIIRIESVCSNPKTLGLITFSIPVATLLQSTSGRDVQDPIPQRVMDNIDDNDNITS